MDMITISAKTLDEAITNALLELQTTSDHLYYEVVQKESAGILGIFGVKPCIIRARVMDVEEEKAVAEKVLGLENAVENKHNEEKCNEEKFIEEKCKEEKQDESESAFVTKSSKLSAEGAAEDISNSVRAGDNKVFGEEGNPEEKKPSFEEKNSSSSENNSLAEKKTYARRDRGRRNSDIYANRSDRPIRRHEGLTGRDSRFSGEERSARDDRYVRGDERPVKEEKPRQSVKADPEKVQNAAKSFLVDVFAAMGMDVSVGTSLDLKEGELQVMLSGKGMGLLIGKRGQTLDSLQYLVSLVVNKETEGYLRVKLDTENYRERRKETLEILARNIANKVKRSKHPISLEPMNPYERRIIHSTLQNDRYVMTRSEGEDPYRHVVVFLKNDRSNIRRERYGFRKDSRSNVISRSSANRAEQRQAEREAAMESILEKMTEKSGDTEI